MRLVARAACTTSEVRGKPSAKVQTATGRAKVSSVAFQRVAPPVWLATWSRRYRLASFAPGSIRKVLIVGVTGASAMWPRALFATSPCTGGGDAGACEGGHRPCVLSPASRRAARRNKAVVGEGGLSVLGRVYRMLGGQTVA